MMSSNSIAGADVKRPDITKVQLQPSSGVVASIMPSTVRHHVA
jgi:hypothetical protein